MKHPEIASKTFIIRPTSTNTFASADVKADRQTDKRRAFVEIIRIINSRLICVNFGYRGAVSCLHVAVTRLVGCFGAMFMSQGRRIKLREGVWSNFSFSESMVSFILLLSRRYLKRVNLFFFTNSSDKILKLN